MKWSPLWPRVVLGVLLVDVSVVLALGAMLDLRTDDTGASRVQVEAVESRVESFRARIPGRRYPVVLAEVVAHGWMDEHWLRDENGMLLTYGVVGREVRVCAAGNDRRHGTRDDVCSAP